MENRTRDSLLRLAFNFTRASVFMISYMLPIVCLWVFNNEQDFIKFFFNINFILNIFFVGASIIFSNFISLKIFRKIEKKLYPNGWFN